MKVQLENVKPMDIEKRSFEIITEELGDKKLVPGTELVVKRCIHTSADFDYADNLCFSPEVIEKAMAAIKDGACIVTDTQMAKSGINKTCPCPVRRRGLLFYVGQGCGGNGKEERYNKSHCQYG